MSTLELLERGRVLTLAPPPAPASPLLPPVASAPATLPVPPQAAPPAVGGPRVGASALGAEIITVAVLAGDPISYAGLRAALRDLPWARVVTWVEGPAGRADEAASAGYRVTVVAGDRVDAGLCARVGELRADGGRVVLCLAELDAEELVRAVRAGASGVLRRAEATSERLGRAVRAAALGDDVLPLDLLGALLRGAAAVAGAVTDAATLPDAQDLANALSHREVLVLRLIADGLDTREIADTLCYSERTVKNVIHAITTRLALRNRAHAVAWALRMRLI